MVMKDKIDATKLGCEKRVKDIDEGWRLVQELV